MFFRRIQITPSFLLFLNPPLKLLLPVMHRVGTETPQLQLIQKFPELLLLNTLHLHLGILTIYQEFIHRHDHA